MSQMLQGGEVGAEFHLHLSLGEPAAEHLHMPFSSSERSNTERRVAHSPERPL